MLWLEADQESARGKTGEEEPPRGRLGYYPHRTCMARLINNRDVELGKLYFFNECLFLSRDWFVGM